MMGRNAEKQKNGRRNGFWIMIRLSGLVKPLLHVMAGAVLLGVSGYLCAIFLTVMAGAALLTSMGVMTGISLRTIFVCIVAAAVLRGVLHYGEQACNHFIAFKLLAIIRHNVFDTLRKLCPAKLDGRDRGNLISIITSDIELLEVFYAHTISPAAIAFVLTGLLEWIFFHYHPTAAVLAFAGYVAVGVGVPLWNSRRGAGKGMEFRNRFGELNSFVLDSLRGLDETIQYSGGEKRKKQIEEKTEELDDAQKRMKKMEGSQRGLTSMLILVFSFGMLFLTAWLFETGEMTFEGMLLCTILMMGSFGPFVALSSLSNNLMQTLASGERVLSLLEEEPQVVELKGKKKAEFGSVNCRDITFAYENEVILDDVSVKIPRGTVTGIHGKSGSGKSTLLKLLMRFYDPDSGNIQVGGREIQDMNTADLRNMISYMTQDTCLFHDSVANNIAVGKPGASRKDIEEAARKASLHDFILSLPRGYDTPVGELGDTLSGGERQRIGLARAFLHDAPMFLLDEPTSNLDALNEGAILKTLREKCTDKTVVLVSHRESTLAAAHNILYMKNGRMS